MTAKWLKRRHAAGTDGTCDLKIAVGLRARCTPSWVGNDCMWGISMCLPGAERPGPTGPIAGAGIGVDVGGAGTTKSKAPVKSLGLPRAG